MSILVLFLIVLVLYIVGRLVGSKVGGNPSIFLGLTLGVLVVNVITMFKPDLLGLFGSLLGMSFPFFLGAYRGSKNRALRDQSGSGSGSGDA